MTLRRKRILDLLVSIPLSIVLTPAIAVLAIGSWISFRAWPFFSQPRLGLDGEEFRFVKLRSLPRTAPSSVDKFELEKVENTRWGSFLRRWHLDELPQVWLVVLGTMSLVGPRPEMPALAARFDPIFVKERLTARPGCTGLWQISTDSAGLIGDAPEWDLHYIRNWTLRLDIWAIMWTAWEVVTGRSITSLDAIPAWTGAAPGATAAPERHGLGELTRPRTVPDDSLHRG